ncbi:MAG TPA: VOC family protein [Gaiellaceae bacterium]|nr:VOC family protein [Gaiellaceae bacterium]
MPHGYRLEPIEAHGASRRGWRIVIDHVGVNVSDYARAKAFYERALAPLGITVQMELGTACGFGVEAKPFSWIRVQEPVAPVHVAFTCEDRSSVERFHEAALAAGGVDNGGPGLRPHYHPTYFAAFVRDPDSNNVEAVCHRPPAE